MNQAELLAYFQMLGLKKVMRRTYRSNNITLLLTLTNCKLEALLQMVTVNTVTYIHTLSQLKPYEKSYYEPVRINKLLNLVRY